MWFDEDEDSNVRYVFLACDGKGYPPVLVVFTKTSEGWKTRSTSVTCELDHDYDSKTTFEEIMDGWISQHVRQPFFTNDYESAIDALLRKYDTPWPSTGRFFGNPEATARERAERVVRHLTMPV